MKECKVVALEGKTLTDYGEQINTMLRGSWSLLGSFGKNNMLLIFSRTIQVTEGQ